MVDTKGLKPNTVIFLLRLGCRHNSIETSSFVVQILVVVANTQVRTLRTEVGKGSV